MLTRPPLIARQTSERIAARLLSLLRNGGEDLRPILAAAGVGCSADPLVGGVIRELPQRTLRTIVSGSMLALAAKANAQEGRPAIRAEDWGMLFHCLVASRTLRDAMGTTCDFYRMLDDRLPRISLHTSGDITEIRVDTPRAVRNVVALTVDSLGLAALHGMFCWLARQTLPVVSTCLCYGEEMWPELVHEAMPSPVALGAERAALRFPAAYLDYSIARTADDRRNALALRLANDLPDPHDQAALPEQVRLIMYRALRDSQRLPSLDEISDRLGQARATLRRHLSEAGASYNEIKMGCRRDLGLELLRNSSLSIEDIASRLGFCDSDTFRRSCRDWTGLSPSQYRKGELRSSRPVAAA